MLKVIDADVLTEESTRVDEEYSRYITRAGVEKRAHMITIPPRVVDALGIRGDLNKVLEWSVRLDEAGRRYLRVRGIDARARKCKRSGENRTEVHWNNPGGTGSHRTTIPAAMAADLKFGEAKRGRWVIKPDGGVRLYPYWKLLPRRSKPLEDEHK